MKLHGILYFNLQDVNCCFSSSCTKGGFLITVTIVKKPFFLVLIPNRQTEGVQWGREPEAPSEGGLTAPHPVLPSV